MAIHNSTVNLLRESLQEYLEVAEYCVTYRKDNNWGPSQTGGCLGYPAATLMFSIADTMGSYHREKKDFEIIVDNIKRPIKKDGYHHFFIFNSQFYELNLSERIIKKLYENYRNLLLHNAALAKDHFLFIGNTEDHPFRIANGKPHVNVSAFFRVTKHAVEKFLSEIDRIVPGSHQESIINLKK